MKILSKNPLSGLWTIDACGTYVLTHREPAGLMPEAEELTLPAWLSAVHAGDGAQCALAVAEALENESPFQIEFPMRCIDGAMRHVLLSGLPARQPANAGRQFSGFIVDMTEQREAWNAALRSAAEYRLLIENSTDLIAHCGPDGRYLSMSPSYGWMMGWDTEKMVGQSVVDFLHPDDQQRARQALLRIFNGGAMPHVVEVRKRHRDGHYITLGTKASAVNDPATGVNIGAVLVSRDITRDKEMLRNLEERASRDSLTGLPNRAWINERVGVMLERAEENTYTTILFMDLNGFKAVNDTLGHAAGDLLLQQVAERLQRCMRPGDVVARLGGDEFVVAANCSDRTVASAIAQRLLDALKVPFRINDGNVSIGAAIGISLAPPGAASTSLLFQNADAAMYSAKARRDGSYQIF